MSVAVDDAPPASIATASADDAADNISQDPAAHTHASEVADKFFAEMGTFVDFDSISSLFIKFKYIFPLPFLTFICMIVIRANSIHIICEFDMYFKINPCRHKKKSFVRS